MTLAFEDELACDVSVVVPTYNRRSILRRTLESLVAQRASAVRYEVLVVDNNSSDDTREMVEVFSREHPRIRYLFEPRQGVSHARNTGVAAARAPLLAFIDDDVEAGPTWVAAIKQAFDAHPEIDCLGGRIEPRWTAPPPPWLTPMFWAAVALQAGKGDSPYIDADHASPCLMTANFACRRTALQQVGGFSVAYLRDEDRELQLRLWAAGKRGMYVDEVAVTTEVPLDRLTKSYHRQFYARVGQSHARMRYLDRIDVAGRLLREIPPRVTLLGTPAFIYRQMLFHVARLVWTTVTLQRHRAFFHQTRVLYFVSYVRRRQREERHSLWALPRELSRLLTTLLQRPLRRGVAQSLSERRPTSGEAAALPEQTLRT
jgi:glycosyltransferase involved in cell wall biosynthesis